MAAPHRAPSRAISSTTRGTPFRIQSIGGASPVSRRSGLIGEAVMTVEVITRPSRPVTVNQQCRGLRRSGCWTTPTTLKWSTPGLLPVGHLSRTFRGASGGEIDLAVRTVCHVMLPETGVRGMRSASRWPGPRHRHRHRQEHIPGGADQPVAAAVRNPGRLDGASDACHRRRLCAPLRSTTLCPAWPGRTDADDARPCRRPGANP